MYGNTSPLYFRSIFIICDAHTTKLFGSTNFKMRTPYLSGGHFGSRRTLGRSRALAVPRTCYSFCEVTIPPSQLRVVVALGRSHNLCAGAGVAPLFRRYSCPWQSVGGPSHPSRTSPGGRKFYPTHCGCWRGSRCTGTPPHIPLRSIYIICALSASLASP